MRAVLAGVVVAIALAVTPSQAQSVSQDAYQVNYFSGIGVRYTISQFAGFLDVSFTVPTFITGPATITSFDFTSLPGDVCTVTSIDITIIPNGLLYTFNLSGAQCPVATYPLALPVITQFIDLVVINVAPADQEIRVINPGAQGSPRSSDEGTVCADIYVFDANQEMMECCSCAITANGLLTLSLRDNLVANTLQNVHATSGAVKIVSGRESVCSETSPTPAPDLRAFSTHRNGVAVTETEFQPAPLQQQELNFLGQTCAFVQYLGSGRGACNCTQFLQL